MFDDKATFAEWFSDALGKQGGSGGGGGPDEWLETEKRVVVIHRLHQILEPFMLRRQVQDVEGKLPPKVCAHHVDQIITMLLVHLILIWEVSCARLDKSAGIYSFSMTSVGLAKLVPDGDIVHHYPNSPLFRRPSSHCDRLGTVSSPAVVM